jgi:hypothetical protein
MAPHEVGRGPWVVWHSSSAPSKATARLADAIAAGLKRRGSWFRSRLLLVNSAGCTVEATRRLAPLLVVVMAFVAAPAADADVRSKRDRGAATGGGPALDVARITAVGSRDGLIVSVRLKANFERAAGRGRLERAAVALVLRPKSRRNRPTILATIGPSRGPTNLVSTRSRERGVARLGTTIDFVIRGGGLEAVRRIEVKTFEHLPDRRGSARASDDIRITEQQARFILGEQGADQATVATPSTGSSCPELLETARGAGKASEAIRAKFSALLRARAPMAQTTPSC